MGFDVFDSGILLSEPYLTMFYNINLLILMHSAKVLHVAQKLLINPVQTLGSCVWGWGGRGIEWGRLGKLTWRRRG